MAGDERIVIYGQQVLLPSLQDVARAGWMARVRLLTENGGFQLRQCMSLGFTTLGTRIDSY
jgi:hypothetical protein